MQIGRDDASVLRASLKSKTRCVVRAVRNPENPRFQLAANLVAAQHAK
jgi:hypothetical protein